jgi:hypothetical protein
MGTFDNRYRNAAEAAAERRLRDAQLDLVRPAATVQGVAALLRQINPNTARGPAETASAEEYEHLVMWLSQAGDDLQRILEGLELPAGRN